MTKTQSEAFDAGFRAALETEAEVECETAQGAAEVARKAYQWMFWAVCLVSVFLASTLVLAVLLLGRW